MNTTKIDELKIKNHLHDAEQHMDDSVIRQLADVRENAIAQENHWFKECIERFSKGYRGLFSASAVTTALAIIVLLPAGEKLLSGDESGPSQKDSVTLSMEDPEFYLWLNETGRLVAER